jgi:WD40 repeat protein
MKKAIVFSYLLFINIIPFFAQNNGEKKIKLVVPFGHGNDIERMGASADGKYLVTSEKGSLVLWDIAKEVKLTEIHLPFSDEKILNLAFNTDNSRILVSTLYHVHIVDIKTKGIVFRKDAESADYSTDKKSIYIFNRGSNNSTVLGVIDAENGNIIKEIKGLSQKFGLSGKAVFQEINNGKELIIANREGIIRVDLAGGKVLNSTEHLYEINIRTEDKMVNNLIIPEKNIVVGWNTGKIALYNALTGELIKRSKFSNRTLKNVIFNENTGLIAFFQDLTKDNTYLLEQLDPTTLGVQKNNSLLLENKVEFNIAATGACLTKENKLFFATQNNIAVVNGADLKARLAFKSKITMPTSIYPTEDGSFVFRSTDKALRFINPNTHKPSPIYPQEVGGKLLSYDKKTVVEIVNGFNVAHKIIVSDVEKGTVLNSWDMPKNIPKEGSGYTDFFFDDSNQKLIYVYSDSANVNLFDLKTGKNNVIYKGLGSFYSAKLSPDKKYLAFINTRRNATAKTTFKVLDLTKNKVIVEKECEPYDYAFFENEAKIAFTLGGNDKNKPTVIDILTGKETTVENTTVLNLTQKKGSISIEFAGAPGAQSNLKLKNRDGVVLAEFASQDDRSYFGSAHLSPDNKVLYSIGTKRDVKVWNVVTKAFVGTYYFLENSKDWVFVAPNGLFDGTEKAMKELYFVDGFQTIPLDNLFEKCFTPNLITRLLNGEILPDPQLNDLKSVPTIKIKLEGQQRNLVVENDVPQFNYTTENVKLTLVAEAKDDAISEIKLFHNGKIVGGGGTRNLVVEDDKIEKIKTQVFDIQLVEGENRFKAIALNSQRTESQPDEIIINYKPKTTPSVSSGSTSDIQLYLVVVGINKYKNPKYNLNYATADATSLKEAIEKGGSSIFNKTNVLFIGDDKATKAGISDELEKVKTNAKAQDVFIFYYAGHGVLNQKKDFFLVPHDVTQLYGQDDALAQKGLSANQLQQFSKDIKAQKQLFILDACQSAGALDQIVAARGAAEEKAIAQLARATGTHWLTASGSEQFASEFTQLGHGTFTYVLLEALSGKADKGGDKKITVKELDAYLQEQVPEVTAKYKGTPQYPASYGFGNDFPIGVVKN